MEGIVPHGLTLSCFSVQSWHKFAQLSLTPGTVSIRWRPGPLVPPWSLVPWSPLGPWSLGPPLGPWSLGPPLVPGPLVPGPGPWALGPWSTGPGSWVLYRSKKAPGYLFLYLQNKESLFLVTEHDPAMNVPHLATGVAKTNKPFGLFWSPFGTALGPAKIWIFWNLCQNVPK